MSTQQIFLIKFASFVDMIDEDPQRVRTNLVD